MSFGWETTQERVVRIGSEVFGRPSMTDPMERALRFGEEAMEVLRACGVPYSLVLDLLNYEYSKMVPGEIPQELAGAQVTLYALADVHGVPLDRATEVEIKRVRDNKEKCRAKSAAKPDHLFSTRSVT